MRERYEGSHKFGHDPFTAWLYELSLCDPGDEQCGAAHFLGWHARYGRHVLVEDCIGFVDRYKVARGETLDDFVRNQYEPRAAELILNTKGSSWGDA